MSYRIAIVCLILFAGSVMTKQTVVLAGSKGTKKQSFSITGDISNMPQQLVLLEKLRANDSISVVDSVQTTSTGHFSFSGTQSEPCFYRLRFAQQNRYILLSIDKGEAKINAVWPIMNYTVQGCESSIELKSLIDTVSSFIGVMNRYRSMIDSVKGAGSDPTALESTRGEWDHKFKDFVKKYCERTSFEPNGVVAIRILDPNEEMAFYESFEKRLQSKFPGTVMTKEFGQLLKTLKEAIPVPTEVGNAAPDLKLRDTSGKVIPLSSLRGKYVLLDFWASWCGPCRAENPNVLAAYNKFKDKNFTILAVSLDNDRSKWISAVHHDALMWPQVSDLKGWQSPAAAKYGVRGIPMNFLLDPKGVIIAKNLRGPLLEEKLAEVLK